MSVFGSKTPKREMPGKYLYMHKLIVISFLTLKIINDTDMEKKSKNVIIILFWGMIFVADFIIFESCL